MQVGISQFYLQPASAFENRVASAFCSCEVKHGLHEEQQKIPLFDTNPIRVSWIHEKGYVSRKDGAASCMCKRDVHISRLKDQGSWANTPNRGSREQRL